MNAELGFGVIRVFGGPELAGTPAQHLCSRCECAHGLCRRSSKHGLSLVGISAPGDLGQQILKTMLRRYEALGGLWRYRFQRGPQVC